MFICFHPHNSQRRQERPSSPLYKGGNRLQQRFYTTIQDWDRRLSPLWTGSLNHDSILLETQSLWGKRWLESSNTRCCQYLHLFLSKIGGLGTLKAKAWIGTVKPEEPQHR